MRGREMESCRIDHGIFSILILKSRFLNSATIRRLSELNNFSKGWTHGKLNPGRYSRV
jgi:hypothetical protein